MSVVTIKRKTLTTYSGQLNKKHKMKINLINAMMGAGKTTSIISYIDHELTTNLNKQFIYVSPLLAEVSDIELEDGTTQLGRINNALSHHGFVTPQNHGKGKINNFMDLVREGHNICCTHQCFKGLTDKDVAEIKLMGYDLIIDESVEAIEQYTITYADLWMALHAEAITICPVTGLVSWDHFKLPEAANDSPTYRALAKVIEQRAVYLIRKKVLVTEFPIQVLEAFKEVTVMTYIFEGSFMSVWCKMHKCEVTDITDTIGLHKTEQELKVQARKLLSIYEPTKPFTASLSQSAFSKMSKPNLDKLKTSIASYINKSKAKAATTLVTCPKDSWDNIKGKGYSRATWIASNTRATNAYSDMTHIVYGLDKYPHVMINSYTDNAIDPDKYALAEMLQLIWRGCIRNGEPMSIYIVSPRMRRLFTDWLYSN